MYTTSYTVFYTVVESALETAKIYLKDFALSEDFQVKIQEVFGDRFDAVRLEELRQQWASGNFEDLTLFEVRSDAELGGANAAYAGENRLSH